MLLRALLAACFLIAAARADVVPEPPALDPACRPLLGVWQRSLSRQDHWSETWQVFFVDGTGATMMYYEVPYGEPANARSHAQRAAAMTCRAKGKGKMTVSLDDGVGNGGGLPGTLEVSDITPTSFLSQEFEPPPHPPPPDWVAMPVPVTWKRIAPLSPN